MHSRIVVCVALLLTTGRPAAAVELRQVISREHPAIQGTGQGLAVGRDGFVYVSGVKGGDGYVLRISRDGSQKFGTTTTYAITGVAARADGTLATSNAHFAKSVSLYDKTGRELGKVGGFTGNDAVGWDGPGTIEVGVSGDFFALDQHASRIVRVNSAAEIVRSYPLQAGDEKESGRLWPYAFRVCEAASQFYFIVGAELQCRGFDGVKQWSLPTRVGGDPWGGFTGGFDVDDEGRLYMNDGVDSKIRIYDVQGKAAGELTLEMGERTASPQRRISHLRVFANDVVVRQKSDTEIFQVYDRMTGAVRRAVGIEHEQLTVAYPSPVWTAGKTIPLTIRFDAAGRRLKPMLNAWLRPLGTVRFTPLAVTDNHAAVPADLSGLYQMRVGSGLDGSHSEYNVESVVEIRPENAVGSLSLFTSLNRRSYRRGEAIPFSLRCRTNEPPSIPADVEVRLVDSSGDVRHRERIALTAPADQAKTSRLSSELTASLAAGEYRLTASVPRWTIADQYLTLGDGIPQGDGNRSAIAPPAPRRPPFHRVRHGDYTMAFPTVTFFDAPEQIARHVETAGRLGENLFVDRLGHGGGGGLGELPSSLREADLIARLQSDPLAVAPEKAEFENRILQTVAAYGAAGIEQQAILLYMDAGLPIGTGFDKRPPEELERDVESVTRRLADYPGFRGWSWAANWWIEKRGAALASSPAEKSAFDAAFKSAQTTGRWDPVLETVSDRWVEYAIDAERRLRGALQRVAATTSAQPSPRFVSAMTGPYRQPGIIPPLTFANADEIDLHFQAEQIQWPMISAHNVDFYKRPGRPAWGHPELWNDDGTGGQILSDLLQMVMRGAQGVGQSGTTKGFLSSDSDPRGMGPGATSVHRQLNHWLAAYGPWLASLEANDPIAIPVSTHMMRMELDWQGVGGFYFTRLFEAYNACLRAHRPASFVFAEDCKPDSLAGFKGVLLISQTVELDPPLRAALSRASSSGVPIFVDKTSRAELLKDLSSRSLELEFTRIEKEHHLLNDDSAFWRYREHILEHSAALHAALAETVPPIATCQNPEVLLTERRLGDVRVLWVVNDAAIPLDPGRLWRVSLAVGSRMPVMTRVDWPAGRDRDVYELFSGHRVDATGPMSVDLRQSPARVFVAFPRADTPAALAERIPLAGPKPPDEPFGVRIRDVVIGRDNKSALVTAADWNRNAFFVDVQTGDVERQEKIGHHFTYAPIRTPTGFAIQACDLNTAEGYHEYLLECPHRSVKEPGHKEIRHSAAGGTAVRRFALYGLSKRGTSWCVARQLQEAINNFAVSPDGKWVATAGDLGLVVWSSDGEKLWSEDWWRTDRQRRHLLAADAKTLITCDGFTATGRDARTGTLRWSHALGETGLLTAAAASTDARVIALRSTANGGRLFILREGQPANTLATAADELVVSPDGRFVVVAWKNEIRLFETSAGLLWSAVADDVVRSPRFSSDGRRIVAGTELGTLLVFDTSGRRLLERDFGALPVADWLDDGGLLVATWMGRMTRLKPDFTPAWARLLHVEPSMKVDASTASADLLWNDPTPTSRVDDWGNAAPDAAPLAPNLLTETQALIEARCEPTTHGDPRTWQHKIDLLRDGDPTAPSTPWLEWSDINYIDSGWRQKLVVQVDTFRSQIRVRGVTIVEDAAHPESWTRDTHLQWWDATDGVWKDGPLLLFRGPKPDDAKSAPQVSHTHWFDTPLEAAKFRFVSTGGASWPVGNFRWGELVFHGEVLGPSHPDAVANRPVAVLFDEREDDLRNLTAYGEYPFAFRYDDAFSGGKSLALTRAGLTCATWRPPFGHVLPNWDFNIVENPTKPGEYRWLEFAWKAASPETRGLSLRVGPHHGGGIVFHAGDVTHFESVLESKQADTPPTQWRTVRIDLWKLNGKPFSIRSLSLGAIGGGALFDHIRLARAEADLMPPPRN
jgi:hypothetical protein